MSPMSLAAATLALFPRDVLLKNAARPPDFALKVLSSRDRHG